MSRPSTTSPANRVPRIDLAPLIDGHDIEGVAAQVDAACSDVGFFSIVNHGVDPKLCRQVADLAHNFFARSDADKAAVAMTRGGRAWRGWFPLHGELTSGTPDHKEGYYFGRELDPLDPRVRAGVPLHGPNLWPREPRELQPVLTEYLGELERVGHHLARAISVGLGLGPDTLPQRWFQDPVILLRLFRYPAAAPDAPPAGVAEHTDYGFLTMLWQDDRGGLEVRTDRGWVDVAPDPDAFVCNIGDMLERLTGGRYRSTPHRVRSPRDGERISIPFFFDPDWDAPIGALPIRAAATPITVAPPAMTRWDGADVHTVDGTYGEYLLAKVVKVFPALGARVLDPAVLDPAVLDPAALDPAALDESADGPR